MKRRRVLRTRLVSEFKRDVVLEILYDESNGTYSIESLFHIATVPTENIRTMGEALRLLGDKINFYAVLGYQYEEVEG